MKHLRRTLLMLAAALPAFVSGAQSPGELLPVVFEAESGALGAQFTVATDAAGVQYVAITSTVGGGSPGSAERVITYSVTFAAPGTYELYARVRVGPETFNDDSMYYANGFGPKSPTSDADWILANGLAAPVGYTLAADKVVGGGAAQSNVWKWVKLSAFDGGEPPVAGFVVPAGAL